MQRYDHYIREFGETGYKYTSDMQRIENGEWVRHEDAAKLLADRDAEIERLRADLVWVIDAGVRNWDHYLEWRVSSDIFTPRTQQAEHDGTPESICRAVREARDVE